MVALCEITVENFWDVMALAVSPQQAELVLSNAMSLAQARVQPELVPLAICADGVPVGFLMYCIDRDDGEYWLYRLMVDARRQGKDYARQAMALLLDIIRADSSHHALYLGVHRAGEAAVRLYESLGFAFTGQVFGKEHVMVLRY